MPKSVSVEFSTGVTPFMQVGTHHNECVDRCPVCNSRDVLSYWPHEPSSRDESLALGLDECINCGAAFLVDDMNRRL